jgi:S-(hydroxymethyl)glutathione dehydrogenase / alcohol dehydrogenase
MRAAVLVAKNEPLVIEDVVPVPPAASDVVVRIAATGVCHSDLAVVTGDLPLAPPVILGHEGVGIVDWVGSEVVGLRPGDRVLGSFRPACGRCWYCVRGQSHLCVGGVSGTHVARPDGTEIATLAGLGTFAETMTANQVNVVKVESSLPDEQLALIGCGVTTGVGAVLFTAGVEPGATVAVVGCGGVGQSVIQGASIAGASRIIALDLAPAKRDLALSAGATHAVDPADEDAIEQVKELTSGRGSDYVFDVVGKPGTVLQSFQMTRTGGATVVIGVARIDESISLPAFQLVLGERRVLGCAFGSAQVRRDFARMIDLVDCGKLNLEDMVSRRLPLSEVNEAFRAMEAAEGVRSILIP